MRTTAVTSSFVGLTLLSALAVCGLAEGATPPDGIAISTHRAGGGDHGLGVAPAIFGDLVRHDIRAGRVAKSTVIYRGRARGACINFTGDKVAFLKLDGHVCVMNIDGSDVRELTATKNRNASAIEWPAGDWVYYSEQGSSPDGVFNAREKDDTPDKRTIRRVNVLSGEDELAGVAPQPIWQLSMAATTTKSSGRFTVTGALLDFSDPGRKLNARPLNCGTGVSMNGLYVTEMAHSHSDLLIWDWSLGTLLRQFHVNQWAEPPGDGRVYFYRPRWGVNSDRWLVMTNGMDFGCTTRTNMVLYDWRDGRQIQVTSNPLTGGECDEGEDFWLAGMAGDLADGMLEGEAPLTVELDSDKLAGRVWEWDYGDGSRETAAAGRHTFSEPGDYTVTASQGKTVLRQAVTVLERRPPSMTARVLDDRHVLAEFDEPMKLDAASATLASGTPVAGLEAGGLGRDLLISLATPLPRRDSLTLAGTSDLAQEPNPPVAETVPVVQPEWPANRAGLVFLWETALRPSLCLDPARGWFPPVQVTPRGGARFDRFGAMRLEGGVMYATDTSRGITERCRATGEWSLEATLTAATAYQGRPDRPRRIIGCSRDGGPDFCFSLDQEGGQLSVALCLQDGTNPPRALRVRLGPVAAERPQHVVVSYAAGRLRGWLDGDPTLDREIGGTLPWQNAAFVDGLHFGGREQAGPPWRGTIEGVAISCRAVGAEDARGGAAAYADLRQARPQVPRLRLRGRLAAKAAAPRPEDVFPYRSALVVHEYAVEKLLDGTHDGETIRVAHWGLLDAQPAPVTGTPVGASCELLVEPYDDHPELTGQVLRELDENVDLPLFFDVSNGPGGEPRLARLSTTPKEVWMPVGMPVPFSPQALDQYDEPIDVPLSWRVEPGGSIDVGTAYGAGRHFTQARQPGDGEIGPQGLFTGTKAGTVTIRLSSTADPALTATAIAGVGDYPAVYPAARLPLSIGAERAALVGDLDRLRLYGRVMPAEEAAANAAGGKPNAAGLIADWTFDERKDDAYANVAGQGLTARVMGQVDQGHDGDRTYVRLARTGWLEVAPDARLDASDALTIEAWVRPTEPGILVVRQEVWMWGMVVGFEPNTVLADAFRTGGQALRAAVPFPHDVWTHLVVAFGPSGAWKIYADGTLVGEREAMPTPVK